MPTVRSSAPAPLPDCAPLFDSAALREADRRATAEHGLPSILLMERAGLASADVLRDRFADRHEALVVIGKGNNGGDGMVVARHLAEAGWRVECVAPEGVAPATDDGATMTRAAASLGLGVGRLDAAALAGERRLIVDALLGTGATGAPRGALGEAVAAIERAPAPVVALDVPSGVEADTGRVAGAAVRAALTVTFGGDMPGLRVEPGRGRCGEVVVVDIGIPSAVAIEPVAWLAGLGAVAAVPGKGAAGDKYGAGAVLVVAGSRGLSGAGVLSARATLRAGAGLTVAVVPASVQPAMAAHLVEVMVAPAPDRDGAFSPDSLDAVLAQARRASAVALGPGLGREEATTAFVSALLSRLDLPLVIDADGLWHVAADLDAVRARRPPTVLTPHAGEAARLLDRSRGEVEADRLAAARELADVTGATVVLKGSGTLVATPGEAPIVCGLGGPELASAGTGDVLTGAVAAFLAKGMDPRRAAAAAVVAHARAGALAGRGDGTVAGDLVEALPDALIGNS